MKKCIILLIGVLSNLFSFSQNKDVIHVLNKVADQLSKIESATYTVQNEVWNHGDTIPKMTFNRYVEEYNNPLDSTIGASFLSFNTEEKEHLQFAYDGYMRAVVRDISKTITIDSFKVRKLPFRPLSAPFYNYTNSIIQYILTTEDNIKVVKKDTGEDIFVQLIISEDHQVEFFGQAYYMTETSNIFTDPLSKYELWIDKTTYLPRKVRREMFHDISVCIVTNSEFNKKSIDEFVATDYFPKDYEISQYRQKTRRKEFHKLIGQKAPDWLLTNINNKKIGLSDLKSKIVMLQFTSMNCGPCRASIPFLKELSGVYNKEDFNFVAIETHSKNANAGCIPNCRIKQLY